MPASVTSKKTRLLLWLLLLMPSVAMAEKADEKMQSRKPFSAEMVEYQKQASERVKTSRVYSGSEGIRLEQLGRTGQVDFMYISNYRSEQEWMLSPGQLFYTLLPSEKDQVVSEETDAVPAGSAGVLSTEPCQGMQKKKRDERKIQDSLLTVWECTDSSGKAGLLQHFSTLLGVVVRQESVNGMITELKNVSLEPLAGDMFVPPKIWREVGLEEYFTGTSDLPKYQD